MKIKTIIVIAFIICSNLVALAQTSNQIIYRDFEPDTCATTPRNPIVLPVETKDTILIDLTGDSIDDLMIYFAGPQTHLQSPYIRCLGQNTYMCVASNDTLSSDSLIWYVGGSPFFPTNGNNYGLRQFDGINYFYGWFGISTSYNDTDIYFCIDKMAFCTIPNYPLLWGQTEIENSVPKTDAGNDGVKINFNIASNTVRLESLNKIKNIEIVSSNGQIVNKTKNVGKNETEINVYGLQNGVYIVKVSLDDGSVVSGKIVK